MRVCYCGIRFFYEKVLKRKLNDIDLHTRKEAPLCKISSSQQVSIRI